MNTAMSNPTNTTFFSSLTGKNPPTYGLIMAGGIGTRFWPVSTEEFPKQFHDLLGTGRSLLQKTFDRLSAFIPPENIRILTNTRYQKKVLEQLPEITENQLVLEPTMRNTAPCILLAALKIHKINPEARMLVAPSDHWIEDENAFQQDVTTALEASKNNILITLGIPPTFPHTGYGYIQFDPADTLHNVYRFTEKPDYQTAKNFIASGNYRWNAGIFVWSTHSIIQAFKNYLPQMYQQFEAGIDFLNTPNEQAFIKKNYPLVENISIDYGILEKADNIKMLSASFDWNDLGSWGALYEKLPKNTAGNAVVHSHAVLENATNNLVIADSDKNIILSGLSGYIVVAVQNDLLILPQENEQDLKQLLIQLKS